MSRADVVDPQTLGGPTIANYEGVWNHSMQQLRDERMLHLFAGRPRLGSLAHAAEQLRVTVDQIDLSHVAQKCKAIP